MAKLVFTTTGCWENTENFGCASLGLAGKCSNDMAMQALWPVELDGIILCGTYEEVMQAAAKVCAPVHAAIVLFGNAGGENEFLSRFRELFACPTVGGGAAIDGATGRSALITGGNQVAVFLITDDRYTYTAHTQCIHDHILERCTLTLQDSRTIQTINGEDAAVFLAGKKREMGLKDTDFEHLTLSDKRNVNAHLSNECGVIKSGRDLQETMLLRYVEHSAVYDAMRAFYDDPDAIIFGCAGLSGLLDRPLDTDSLGLFLFGEVCTVDGIPEFGNLMLSKLRISKK